MTPSSTPGSPSPDDPMPWSDHDEHAPADATRPMPPVSRFPGGRTSDDTAPVPHGPSGSHESSGSSGRAEDSGTEDWSWYDDDQHTRPIPAVTAQRPAQPEAGPAAPAGDHERAGVFGRVPGNGPGHSPRYDPGHAPGHSPGDNHGYGSAYSPGDSPGHAQAPPGAPGHAPAAPGASTDPAARLAGQRDEFGGLQLVPGLFGWLSALALTWLLLALAGLVASALGFRLADGLGGVVDDLAAGSAAAWTAAGVLGAVEFLAFLGGGYTAGRMARFSGAAQGVSVWLWSLFGRSVATVAGLVWADTVGLAPVGVSAQALIGSLLVPGLLAVAAVLVVDLLGALLGGLWGMRYHRRVDRWDDTRR